MKTNFLTKLDKIFEHNVLNGLAKKAGKTEKDFDPEIIKKGIKVEMEHTDDPDIAKKIVLDHLTELGEKYYDELEDMEKKLKKNKKSEK